MDNGKERWDSEEHPPYIEVYHPVSGYKAQMMVWVEYQDMGGMYEPWQTGLFAHKTHKSAEADARSWAEAEGIEYRG